MARIRDDAKALLVYHCQSCKGAFDEETYEVTGDLTIRGVTREVVLTAEVEGSGTDMQGKERVALTAKGAVNRGDYGLTWNQTLAGGNVVVGDKVKLELDIAAVKADE